MNQDPELARLARECFDNYFHKVRAEVTPELWEAIFCKGWHAAMQQTYMPNLSDVEHPEQHARPDSPGLVCEPDRVEAFVPSVHPIPVHAYAEMQVPGMSQAAADVLAERARQITAEDYTPQHDDEHGEDELACAAACYALAPYPNSLPMSFWPWDIDSWKPAENRRNLVKAGALIIAEIERLDRADGKVK